MEMERSSIMLINNKNRPEIIVTGSNGKTTTKLMLASILKRKWSILQTTGNKNLPLHIKATMSQLTSKHQAILLEMGMGKPRAAHRHGRYVKPNIAIFTNIGSAHVGNLGTNAKAIADNKSLIIQYMQKNSIVLLNKDNKNSEWIDTSRLQGKIITIGIDQQADYNATHIQDSDNGITFKVKLDDISTTFFIATHGTHNVYNALFAIAVAHQLQFTTQDIAKGLKNFTPPIKRLNITKLRSKITVIDDTVNANVESVKSAIDVLASLGENKQKIAILGSMLELGDYTVDAHIEIGKYAASKPISAIYTYGNEALDIKKGALEAGFSPNRIHTFNNRQQLHEALLNSSLDNSIILIKGSAAMEMELTVDFFQQWFQCFVQLDEQLEMGKAAVHPHTFERLKHLYPKFTLQFGQHTATLRLKKNESVAEDVLLIPNNCWPEITIPALPYNHYFAHNKLHLGPVIGINVLERYYNEPTLQLLRMKNYDTINGLLYLFRANQNTTPSNTITGKYYDPHSQTFVEAKMPYPSSMFNRVPLLAATSKRLISRIGNNIFNHPYSNTDKLKFWHICSQVPTLKKHLPVTARYAGPVLLFKMLHQYKWIYLKPATLAGGAGIFAIWFDNGRYKLKNEFGKEWIVRSRKRLTTLINKQMKNNKKYIMQEGIASDFDIGKIDFRIYIQKDYTGTWKFTGLESKIGIKGSIIANSAYRQKIMPGHAVLQEFYHLTQEHATALIDKMTALSILTLQTLEPTHHLIGDAALDIIVDKTLNIKILEVQLNYAAEIKQHRSPDEYEVLPQILATPWEYAKYLAGFTPYSNKAE